MLRAVGLISATLCGGGVYLVKSTDENVWQSITMPLIRLLDAEQAHTSAVKLASYGLVPSFKTHTNDADLLKTRLWGISFDSPIGLAAGFDKHAQCMRGMLDMGFGFVEVGSITPLPQVGNPKPRNFRLLPDDAVINRYGFNSFGHDYAEQNLSTYRKNVSEDVGVIGVNLGKNKESPDAVNDYVQGVKQLGQYADYLVINISSPNTPGLRRMQGRDNLKCLVEAVLRVRDGLENKPPLLVKIAPDLNMDDKEDIAAVLTAPETKVDGLIVSNTTITRPECLVDPNKVETGGLSGKPLREMSTGCVRDMYKLTGGQLTIVGAGGVFSGEDAYEKICAGASVVQLYSSLALRGPPVVGKVKRELADILRANGFSNVSEAVGSQVNLNDID